MLFLLDGPDDIARKIARAVTDSDTGPDAVRRDPVRKPGVTNLMDIVTACTGAAVEGVSTYGSLKRTATEAVLSVLDPLRKRYVELAEDPAYVAEVYAAGAAHCRAETAPVLSAARAAVGLG